jgi:hypothetical protein
LPSSVVRCFVALAAAAAGASIAGGVAACHTHELGLGVSPLDDGAVAADADAAADAAPRYSPGTELVVPVPASGRAFVKLASPPAIVTPSSPATDLGWDMAFGGVDAFTNSGPSGHGQGGAFGPLDPIVFVSDHVPPVPFVNADATGGAFSSWYIYDPDAHVLYSRLHVYGVRDGSTTYKVQILEYYSQPDGGPAVPARYTIRYATLGDGQPTQEVQIDGTAGGKPGSPDTPSGCIDLGTGQQMLLTPSAAQASSAWHLCFRRTSIAVNGGAGGPRNVGAVDLQADKTKEEALPDILVRTADTQKPIFDGTAADSFTTSTFLGDAIISALTGQWTDVTSGVLAPAAKAWLVVGADGATPYVVGFERFEGATAASLGSVVMRIKAVQ